LNEQNSLWWYHPPSSAQIDLNIPVEPPELIAKYSAQLIELVSAMAAVALVNVIPSRPQMPAESSLRKM
jgi:hypothetical protein